MNVLVLDLPTTETHRSGLALFSQNLAISFYSVYLSKGLDTIMNTFELLKQEKPGGSRFAAYESPGSPV